MDFEIRECRSVVDTCEFQWSWYRTYSSSMLALSAPWLTAQVIVPAQHINVMIISTRFVSRYQEASCNIPGYVTFTCTSKWDESGEGIGGSTAMRCRILQPMSAVACSCSIHGNGEQEYWHDTRLFFALLATLSHMARYFYCFGRVLVFVSLSTALPRWVFQVVVACALSGFC